MYCFCHSTQSLCARAVLFPFPSIWNFSSRLHIVFTSVCRVVHENNFPWILSGKERALLAKLKNDLWEMPIGPWSVINWCCLPFSAARLYQGWPSCWDIYALEHCVCRGTILGHIQRQRDHCRLSELSAYVSSWTSPSRRSDRTWGKNLSITSRKRCIGTIFCSSSEGAGINLSLLILLSSSSFAKFWSISNHARSKGLV